jgi:preprotein translocase subunit YajC
MIVATTNWGDLLVSLIPLALIFAFWFFLMRGFGGRSARKQMERNARFMDRQEGLLERIAAALERRESGWK